MLTGANGTGYRESLIRWSCGIFKAKGLTHVRIRVAGAPTEARLIHALRKLVETCEYCGVIPIIAYQAGYV